MSYVVIFDMVISSLNYIREIAVIYIYTLSFSNYMFITVILHYDIYTVKHNNFFYWLKGKDATVIIWTYLCGTTCVANGYTCCSTSHVDSTEPEYQRWETCLQSNRYNYRFCIFELNILLSFFTSPNRFHYYHFMWFRLYLLESSVHFTIYCNFLKCAIMLTSKYFAL